MSIFYLTAKRVGLTLLILLVPVFVLAGITMSGGVVSSDGVGYGVQMASAPVVNAPQAIVSQLSSCQTNPFRHSQSSHYTPVYGVSTPSYSTSARLFDHTAAPSGSGRGPSMSGGMMGSSTRGYSSLTTMQMAPATMIKVEAPLMLMDDDDDEEEGTGGWGGTGEPHVPIGSPIILLLFAIAFVAIKTFQNKPSKIHK